MANPQGLKGVTSSKGDRSTTPRFSPSAKSVPARPRLPLTSRLARRSSNLGGRNCGDSVKEGGVAEGEVSEQEGRVRREQQGDEDDCGLSKAVRFVLAKVEQGQRFFGDEACAEAGVVVYPASEPPWTIPADNERQWLANSAILEIPAAWARTGE
ncbi:hypothetical protein RTBOTA2_006845 [Rhodotorula toruloides]|nr:hypothetical protein RTBOTA2_006845 [Rhodotorula toruloides]